METSCAEPWGIAGSIFPSGIGGIPGTIAGMSLPLPDFSSELTSRLTASTRTPGLESCFSASNSAALTSSSEAESRNAISKTRREKEKRVHELEIKIATLEAHQKELVAALEDPAVYGRGGRATAINRDLSAVAHDLARLTEEWERVTEAVTH